MKAPRPGCPSRPDRSSHGTSTGKVHMPAVRSRGCRLWLSRCGLAVLLPLAVILAAEAFLRLIGYGYPVTFLLKSASGEHYGTNPQFIRQFQPGAVILKPWPLSLAAKKPPGTIRLCILGESAAMGTPDPAFAFGRILEVQLRRQFPDRRFEIVNAAMRGINSHVIRAIERECEQHQIDCFVIYMGNNEVIGLHGPDPKVPPWLQSLTLIRASHAFSSWKLRQLTLNLLRPGKMPEQTMADFRSHCLLADDPRRRRNRENFQKNLEAIIASATSAGSKVVLATVAANLKDFPPLQSLHRAGLSETDKRRWDTAWEEADQLAARSNRTAAIVKYLEAASIDDHFAELHFRLAECFLRAGQPFQASNHYALARDWDALQVRVDAHFNDIIRTVAATYQDQGVILVDAEKSFAQSGLADDGIPGEKLFHDHVHPTFAGNYRLASNIYPAVVKALAAEPGKSPAVELPGEQECAEALAFTEYEAVNVAVAMARMTAKPPFLEQWRHQERQTAVETAARNALAGFGAEQAERCQAVYARALAERPDDWVLHYNYASFCLELRRYPQAVEHFSVVTKEFPEHKAFRVLLGKSLQGAGQKERALAEFQAALRLDPRDSELLRLIQKLQ